MSKRILIIEDDADLAEVLKIRLEINGYGVLIAHDGKDGFEQARSNSPDLIILDLGIPKIDGYWVCGLLKKDKRYSKIPIIVITGKEGKECEETAKACGADMYVAKPIDDEDLLAKIRELI